MNIVKLKKVGIEIEINMKEVFLLWHTHIDNRLENGEDFKLIGVYSSIKNAEEAINRTSKLEGFKNNLDGFEISAYKLDSDNWTSGFITE